MHCNLCFVAGKCMQTLLYDAPHQGTLSHDSSHVCIAGIAVLALTLTDNLYIWLTTGTSAVVGVGEGPGCAAAG